MLTPEQIDNLEENQPDRSLRGRVLLPHEIDAIPDTLKPEQIDNIGEEPPGIRDVDRRTFTPTTAAHVAGIKRGAQASNVAASGTLPYTGIPDQGGLDELPEGPSRAAVETGRMAGRTLGMAGRGVKAIGSDVLEAPAQIAGYQEPFRNLKALGEDHPAEEIGFGTREKPLPFEQQTEKTKGVERLARKAATGLMEMEPQLATSFSIGKYAQLPSWVSAGIPMAVTAEGNYDPVGAVIAAGIPGANRLGEAAVSKLLSRIPISKVAIDVLSHDPIQLKGRVVQKLGGLEISNDMWRKFLEQGGGFTAANAYMLATQSPRLLAVPPEERKQAILDTVAVNLAPSILGFLKSGPSETLEHMKPELQAEWRKHFPPGTDPFAKPGQPPRAEQNPQSKTEQTPPTPPPGTAPAQPSAPLTPRDIDAIDTEQQPGGVQSERLGTNEVGQTGPKAGASDSVPSPAGQPQAPQGTEPETSEEDQQRRAQVIAKRKATTDELTGFLRDNGIDVDSFLKNPNDHVTHVDRQNDGSFEVRIEHHDESRGTLTTELVNVAKGESLSNPGRPKFFKGKGTLIVLPNGETRDPNEKPKTDEPPHPTKTLTPVVQIGDTKATGVSHADAINKAIKGGKLTPDQLEAIVAGDAKFVRGFMADDGSILDRKQGAAWFKATTGKETNTPGELHSADLEDAGLLEHLNEPPAAVSTGTTNPNPTTAQAEAGNYSKRQLKVHGLEISIENEPGSIRKGTDKDGNPWEVKMPSAYGYVKGTKDNTKEQVDVYVGPVPATAPKVYVIDQHKLEGGYDEPKALIGFKDINSAVEAYNAAFSDGKGPQRMGAIKSMSIDEFKEWLKKPGKVGKPAPAAAEEKPTVPETPETIALQVGMLKNGLRDAMVITPGEKMPDVPKGFETVKTRIGTVIYNPRRLTDARVQAAVSSDRSGLLLGYGIPRKPAKGTEIGAVVIRTKDGVEKIGVLTDQEHLESVKKALTKYIEVGDTMNLEPEADVIARRKPQVPALRQGEETIADNYFGRSTFQKDQTVLEKANQAQVEQNTQSGVANPKFGMEDLNFPSTLKSLSNDELLLRFSANTHAIRDVAAEPPSERHDAGWRWHTAIMYQEIRRRGLLKAEIPALEKYLTHVPVNQGERKAGDLEGLTDDEINALMDAAEKGEAKPEAPAATPPKPTPPSKPKGRSLAKTKGDSAQIKALRDRIHHLNQRRPVAEDMAMNDKGRSLDKLEHEIREVEAQLNELLKKQEPVAPKPEPAKQSYQTPGELLWALKQKAQGRVVDDRVLQQIEDLERQGVVATKPTPPPESTGMEGYDLNVVKANITHPVSKESKARAEEELRRRTAATPNPEAGKSAADILKEAAAAGVKGVDESIKGLHDLFGGGKHMGSGPTFDEETYKKAKPHFERAYDQFKKAGKSLGDFFKFIFEQFGAKVRPYLTRFIQELRDAAKGSKVESTDETGAGSNVGTGARPPGATVAGESGNAPEAGNAGEGTGSRGGTNLGAPGSLPEEGNRPGAGQGNGNTGLPGTAESGVRPGPAAKDQPVGESSPEGVPAPTQPPAKPARRPKPATAPKSDDPNAVNHVIGPNDEIAPRGRVGKLTANINAIQILKKVEEQKRNATPEEKAQLAKYTGWGALANVFDSAKGEQMILNEDGRYAWNRDEKWEKEWGKYYKQIKALLTPEEWAAAARSTQYAHFTSKTVVSNMWDIAKRLGFSGGTVLERAGGIGHFFGLAPEDIRAESKFVGIERDPLSARIMAKLYPEATVFNKDTADVKIPKGSIDLNITNVPFSASTVDDPAFPLKLNLHNWFIAKMIDDAKPGGLVITVTSGHTMDSQAAMREFLAGRAELIGAIRLPNTAFKENAGTEVTTDILFLRKPMTPTPQIGQPWQNMKEIHTFDSTEKNPKVVMVNEYFADHPEMILGRPSLEGTMHAGRDEYATLPFEDKTLEESFKEAIKLLPEDVFGKEPAQMVDFASMTGLDGRKENTLFVKDGTLALVNDGKVVDPGRVYPELKKPERIKQARAYADLSGVYADLRTKQRSEDATEAEIEAARKELNAKYDAYLRKYGALNDRKSDFLSFEQAYYLVTALERDVIRADPKTGKVTKTFVKADIFTKRTQWPKVEPDTATSPSDALQISLSYRGTVDVPYMAKLLSATPEDVERELLDKDLVFRNPDTTRLETPEQYLSGNVREKLRQAETAAQDETAYARNVDALTKAQPAFKPFRKIRGFLGSTWIPSEIVTEFARNLFGSRTGGITYNKTADAWIVGGFQMTPEVRQTYGTERKDGEDILTSMLNQKTIKIYDTYTDADGNEHREFNEKETQKVKNIADKLEAAFQQWMRGRKDIQTTIEHAYNNAANNYALRTWDIGRLDLPGASQEVRLRANQRNAIWRFIQERHGLGAETVGAGKTFIQIGVAMEARRLGLAKKPMITVMNSTLGQFAQSFRKFYPDANILVASRDDLTREKRKSFLGKIASGDWDAIVIPHSQFNMLEDDPAWERQMIQKLLDDLEDALREARAAAGNNKRDLTVKQIEKQKERLEDKLHELADRKKEDVLSFQDLGVDMLMVDEAHEFKKPPFTTKRDNIAGLSKEMSQRALSLYMKVRYVQSKNGGRGAIGFTGTPVTNTLGEAWHMLNLFSPHILKDFGVETFDRFLSTFTRVTSEFDVNAVGDLVLKDKLSRFTNLSEMVKMIRASWDVVTQDDLRPILEAQGELYPKLKGGRCQTISVPLSPGVSKFVDFLRSVYAAYGELEGIDRKTYSYIPVLTFLAGKAAALDMRLVDPTAADDPQSKINVALKDAFTSWEAGKEQKLTQAIFLDQMNPFTRGVAKLQEFAQGEGIHYEPAGEKEVEGTDDLFLYRDMKKKLIAMGVPESEILIVNEHDTKKPTAYMLFDKIKSGEFRIVIGSTAKMGVGVNMQDRMIRLTHLDVPWYPALLEQRNGRIERPGNMNKEIEMAYYGMERTADVGLYAKNEAKAKFCAQVLSGRVDAEEIEDPAGPLIMSMAEQMAALSGDPLLFEKVQLESRIRTLRMQLEAFQDDQESKARSKEALITAISNAEKDIKVYTEALAKVAPGLEKLTLKEPEIDAVIGGRPYTDQKTLVEAIDAVLKQHSARISKGLDEKQYPWMRRTFDLMNDGELRLGKVNGVDLMASFMADRELVADDKGERSLRNRVSVTRISAPVTIGDTNVMVIHGYPTTGTGAIQALKESAKRGQAAIDDRARAIAANKAEIEEIDRLLNAGFSGDKELSQAEARYEQLRQEVYNNQTGNKAAELLFELGIDKGPLLYRLRNELDQVAHLKDLAQDDYDRAEFREDTATTGSKEALAATSARGDAHDKLTVLTEREATLTKRLAVVEKARLEGEISGDAWLLPFGKTPSTRPGISFDATPAEASDGPAIDAMIAQGMDNVRAMLMEPNNGLSPEARRLAVAILNEPVMASLDWSQLQVSIHTRLLGNVSGLTSPADYLIQLAYGARPTTFPHEMFHLLEPLLPAGERERLEELRQEALDRIQPQIVMPLETWQRVRSGEMTSKDFVDMAAALGLTPDEIRELYPLINRGEFLAFAGSEDYARENSQKAKEGWFDNFIERLKSWIRGMVNAVRKFFGRKATVQEIAKDLLAGKYMGEPGRDAVSDRAAHADIQEPENRQAPADAGVTPGNLEMQDEIQAALEEQGQTRTRVFGRVDTILGREILGDAERAQGAAHAAAVFAKAGLQMEQQANGLWKLVDEGLESEIEGQRLLKLLQDEISNQGQPGQTGYLGNLLNSVVENMTADRVTAFSPQLRRELYAVAQGERSHRGIMLASLGGLSKTVQYVARNVDVVLHRTYSDAFGGEFVRSVIQRVATYFRDYFTEAEIEAALRGDPRVAEFLDRALILNRKEEGGRVYKRAQSLLKPKGKKQLAALEADARVTEAVNHILEQLKQQGVEPKPSPNKPLSPLYKLLLMVEPKTSLKIDKAISNAIDQASHNAGIKYALISAKDEQERADLEGRFLAGEEPTDEQVEAGLELPEYHHWKVLRDTLLDYNPITVRLAEDLIRSEFAKTKFGTPKAKAEDIRIDLERLAKSPQQEVARVLGAYLTNMEAQISFANASDGTRQRVMQMIESTVTDQLEKARERVRSPLFQAPVERNMPPTPEQRLGQLLNAGLFSDPRLDLPEMVARVASKSAISKMTPKLPDLVKQALDVPFYEQGDIKKNFAKVLMDRLGVTPEQADHAAAVFEQAFANKFAIAREKAAKLARESITPKQPKEPGPKKALWKKVIENVNAGNFDTGKVLQDIARAHGWTIPDEATVAKLKDLAERIERMRLLTKSEREQVGDNPDDLARAQREKDAVTLEKRVALKKQIETIWAKLTRPISWRHWVSTRRNFAAAANEFEVANILFKVGFPIRLATHIITQLSVHTPTRAIGQELTSYFADKEAGRPVDFWRGMSHAMIEAYRDTFKSLVPALQSARAALAGRAEARNVDRLMSGVQAMDRLALQADELRANGKHAQAFALGLISMIRLSLRVTQAIDNFQGTPAEAQELRAWVIARLRENGRSRAEAEMAADGLIGEANDQMPIAVADVTRMFEANGITAKPVEIQEAARELVKARTLERMRGLGLPADDFEAHVKLLRRTIAWQERVTTGPGAVVSATGKGATQVMEWFGLPFSFARFANAMGTGINYFLMYTPIYGVADARRPGAEHSPWFRTETDRMQRRVQAILGSLLGGLVLAMAAMGALIVRTKWRDDKEKALLEAQGHRLGTVEIPTGDGGFIPLSLTVGPASLLAPYLAAGGAIYDLSQRRAQEQAKLNAEAEKMGLPAGKIRPVDAADVLGVGLAAAERTLMGSRTATGLQQSITENGLPNSRKALAAYLSPMVPLLPGLQEVSRMGGVSLDSRLASVWDYMMPLPSSQARAVNVLGDPVGTPDDVQRVIQTISGGSYPYVSGKTAQGNAYEALFSSGWLPPTVDASKGYAVNGQFRPLNDAELAKFAAERGSLFKAGLGGFGTQADASMVKSAFQQAQEEALQRLGVDTTMKPMPTAAAGGSGASSQATAINPAQQARYIPGGMGMGRSRVGTGRTLRSLGVRTGLRKTPGIMRGPSLRRPARSRIGRPAKAMGRPKGIAAGRSLRPRVSRRG